MHYLTTSFLLIALSAIQAEGAESINPVFEANIGGVGTGNVPEASKRIDELVFSRLGELNLKPANQVWPNNAVYSAPGPRTATGFAMPMVQKNRHNARRLTTPHGRQHSVCPL